MTAARLTYGDGVNGQPVLQQGKALFEQTVSRNFTPLQNPPAAAPATPLESAVSLDEHRPIAVAEPDEQLDEMPAVAIAEPETPPDEIPSIPVPISPSELSPADASPAPAPSASAAYRAWQRVLRWMLWAELILLLALVQMLFAGYSMGVGNQSIQIPFLKKAMNPKLFDKDVMVDQTLQAYPSYFFRVLGKGIAALDTLAKTPGGQWFDPILSAYFWLHVLTTGAVLATAYALGRAMFKSRASAAVLVLLLLAGHHRALAGDEMYSHGFTHTWAVFPMALGAIALFYRGHHVLSFAIVGLIFNLHALTAAYLFAMFGLWAALEFRQRGWLRTLALCGGVFAILAAPTLYEMARNAQQYDALWLARMRTRSAEHSFPFTWWTSGNTDIPRFALLLGLAGVSLGFSTDPRRTRKSLCLAGACLIMFLLGTIFTEIWPIPSIIRAQFFRASRLLAVIAIAHIAHGVACGLRLAVGHHLARIPPGREPLPWPNRILEGAVAAALFLCVAVPGFLSLGFWILLVALVAGVIQGRVSGFQAAVASIALFIIILAAEMIDFAIPGIGSITAIRSCLETRPDLLWGLVPLAICIIVTAAVTIVCTLRGWGAMTLLTTVAAIAIVASVLLSPMGDRFSGWWIVTQVRALINGVTAENTFSLARLMQDRLVKPAHAGGIILLGSAAAAVFAYLLLRMDHRWPARLNGRITLVKLSGLVIVHLAAVAIALESYSRLSANGASKDDEWIQAQLWAARHAPADAVFLTPPQLGGFRIHSDRAVVGEWRDGTQLYFRGSFANDWSPRMDALRPTAYDEMGNVLSRGPSLEQMSDKEIVSVARRFDARYVVLPTPPRGKSRELYERFANEKWTVYEARIPDADDIFLETVAQPNIIKNRMSPVRLTLCDAQGSPITEGEYQVTQTKQDFLFGCSIPPFEKIDVAYEWTAPPVREKQLERMKEVFNFSMIPFSAKWNVIEPVQGQRNYQELDKYVDWCTKNGIAMEFHYLGGFLPQWARRISSEQLKEAWFSYCRETVERYHDRIKYWQITNDKYMSATMGELAKEIRQKYPDLRLGISDCAKFHSTFTGPEADLDMMGKWGLAEIELLQSQNAPLDFFCTHGHKPFGCWPDMRVVYYCLDRYAQYGIKVHITEVTISLAAMMSGTRDGKEKWTPEAQARFFEVFYTTLFSHPAVEAINYWDLSYSVPRDFYGRGMGRPMRGPGGFGSRGPSTQPVFGEAGLLDPTKNDEPRLGFLKLKELIRDRWMTRLSGKLDKAEELNFRGFHGEYEVTVKTPAGQLLRATFAIRPNQENEHRLTLTPPPPTPPADPPATGPATRPASTLPATNLPAATLPAITPSATTLPAATLPATTVPAN